MCFGAAGQRLTWAANGPHEEDGLLPDELHRHGPLVRCASPRYGHVYIARVEAWRETDRNDVELTENRDARSEQHTSDNTR